MTNDYMHLLKQAIQKICKLNELFPKVESEIKNLPKGKEFSPVDLQETSNTYTIW